MQAGRACVRPSECPCVLYETYDYVPRTNDWTWKRQFLHAPVRVEKIRSLAKFSPKSSTCLIFILKTKIRIEYIREYLANGEQWSKHCYCRQFRNSREAFRLAYLYLTLHHSKSRSQGHAHLDCEYVANGDRYCKHCNCHYIGSHMWSFDWHIYI